MPTFTLTKFIAMKKLFLILTAISLFSCSESQDTVSANPNLLQKVVFFVGQSNEVHWYFNSNGLLSEIKSPDGTLLEKFDYDFNNNVIKDTKYGNGAGVYEITYNSNNLITSINGQNCSFDNSTRTYSFALDISPVGEGNGTCMVNDDKLAINSTFVNSISHEFVTEIGYQNGNMVAYDYTVNNGPGSEHRMFNHGGISNPLKDAALPVFRLKSLIDPSFFIEGISSVTMVENVTFGNANPYYFNYGFLIHDDGRPEQQDREIYNGSELEFFYTFAQYYYQGQILP